MNIKKKPKKAQITFFVIIIIVIVALIPFILNAKNIIQKIREIGTPEQAKLSQYGMNSCVEKSSKEALRIISAQGGFLVPEDYFSDGTFHVAYWYNKSEDISPTLDDIEAKLSDTTDIRLASCVNLEKYGINYTKREPMTKTEIKTDYIFMDINYPVTIIVGDNTYRFEEFSAKLNARLGKIYEVARAIVIEQTKHPDTVCLTCLSDIGIDNDVNITIGARNETLIVKITDENSKVFGNPYEFKFAMRI